MGRSNTNSEGRYISYWKTWKMNICSKHMIIKHADDEISIHHTKAIADIGLHTIKPLLCDGFRFVLRLSLLNPLKPCVKSNMKM